MSRVYTIRAECAASSRCSALSVVLSLALRGIAPSSANRSIGVAKDPIGKKLGLLCSHDCQLTLAAVYWLR